MPADAFAARSVCLIVPGAPETLTGGYLYDRRIFEELARLGWVTNILSLDASFPTPTDSALVNAKAAFDALPDGQLVVIDGLALTGLVSLLPAIAKRLCPVALIHHPLADETGIDAARARTLKAAEQSALALVPRIIVTSPWTRRRLADYDVDPARVAVVEPGIDRELVAAREPSSTVQLLTVATVTPRKGHALLIEALSRLKHLDWSLRCAGSLEMDPVCASALRAQIEQTGLNDRVSLLGEVAPANVGAEYGNADLFVLASYLEGYGMALAEAIAHGLPVVSTTAGAIPDTVPAQAACLVPPGNVDALTDVLDRLIGDSKARSALLKGARDAAGQIPGWQDAARKFAGVLHQRTLD